MNVSRWIDWWAVRTPHKIAIRFEGAELSYRDLADDIYNTVGALKRLGIRKGSRVAWLGFNSPDFLITLFACARIGAIIVPLNFRLAAREHLFMLRNANAKMLVFDPRFGETAELIAEKRKSCRLVCSTDAGHDSAEESLPAIKRQTDAVPVCADVGSDDPLLIIYTSGTTGRPKGAVLTHRSLHWNALNSQVMHDLHRDDSVLTTLPFFHVGGLNIQTTPALQVGATVMLIEKFHAGEFLALVERERPTLTVLVPTQMQAVAAHVRWHDADLSSLRCVTTGSTIVQMPLLNLWDDHGIPVIQVYGCTESGPIAIHQVIETAHTTAGSVGRPAMYCEVRIVDGNGRTCADGEAGEVLLRGPNMFLKYWKDPEASETAFDAGWLHTGDIGMRDEQGNYYVVDRKKRVIISGGENIYPSELERILNENPHISECAVVGVPHDDWGEVPAAAFVCAGEQALGKDDLLPMFEGRLGHLKHPQHFVRLDELPKNAMGKVVFSELQATIVRQLAT